MKSQQKGSSWRRVALFGMTDGQEEQLQSKFKDVIPIFRTDCVTDLIALPFIALVISSAAMTQQEVELIFGYFEELDDFPELVAFIGSVSFPHQPKGRIRVFDTYEKFLAVAPIRFYAAYMRKALEMNCIHGETMV
ncbi:MAG: hypothetical protein RR336_02515 [Oscillospiraceae bacterium]